MNRVQMVGLCLMTFASIGFTVFVSRVTRRLRKIRTALAALEAAHSRRAPALPMHVRTIDLTRIQNEYELN
jgi:hypothetical protein